jgi:YwiC-like protein
MVLLPKEHGAYGQLALPIVTALSATGVSTPGLFLTATAVAGFLAHEPASILLGLRGSRVKRELRKTALRSLVLTGTVAMVAGTMSLFTMESDARRWIAVPIVPAVLFAMATIRGRQKSWYGETAASFAFAGVAVPLSIVGGASVATAAAVAVPFVFLFVSSTLAVRTIILRVRGGGDARAVRNTRASVFAVAIGGAVFLGWLITIDALPAVVLVASTPGLLTAVVIAARPPQPSRLRAIGWTLVGVSVLTAGIVIATVR